MRNLIVLNRGLITPESRTYPDLQVIDSVFDTISDSITKSGKVTVLASFPISSQLLNFIHFVDSTQLIFVFGNGDIVTATYDPYADLESTVIEIVGSIDVGISGAQWSVDEETLAIVTQENKLLLLSRIFEPICEKVLDSNDIKISDSKHVSVGWGKKETQFKGKGFKALEREREALKHAGLDDNATQLRDPTVNEIERGTLSRYDNQSVQISWRGDCEYFSVSTIEPVLVEDTGDMYDRRVIRVFNREGELDSVNEAVDGLEHNLSWKPQGSLIASTQRHIDDEDGEEVLDLVFYERNGLNPETEIIESLTWSSDKLFADGIIFAKFHPEKPLNLMIGTSTGIQVVDLTYKIVTGPTQLGDDVGMTLVADGYTAKITPLSIANVPPPISFRELDVLGCITDLAVSKSNEKYAALRTMSPHILGTITRDQYTSDPIEVAKQIALSKTCSLCILDLKEIVTFPALCRDLEVAYDAATDQYEAFGISRNGKLFRNETQVVSGVTSLKITESHLLFTTVFQNLTNENIVDERIRQIERGSILVNAMPTKYSVVLEAPRGNLETICPRIMVMLYRLSYPQNDLDILHDYDPELFFNNVELFIKQIEKVDYLDLFVSCLHEEDATVTKYRETINDAGITQEEIKREGDTLQPAFKKNFSKKEQVFASFSDSKVNRICEAILAVLLKPEYFDKYLQTILTAYACEKPANLVEALKLIGSMKDQEQKETAVTHLCFLQDVNQYTRLFGLYDVKLTLVIAQQSQMDPKEYLPFLQNLHFLIDDYLKNYELALSWLHEQGEASYAEFDDYVVQHDLYKPALKTYVYDKARTNAIMKLFAEHLKELKEFGEAETAEKLVDTLTEDHKYSDAAEIEYLFWATLKPQSSSTVNTEKTKKPELIESVVDVQIGEGLLKRLRELRTKKQEDPYSFYGVPDDLDTPDNVSYTGKTAGTAKQGRKGTIYEEEYLIKSVGRLLERLEQTQPDAIKLIEGNIDEIHNMSEKDRERIDDNGEVT
ncbi:Elongator complex protein 1 [Candida viswanathii]|uniref:Elongator complex protein 1 n=1 Tax=Candida viswanathii TaxID=5486 RepID=A0A367XST7_9ASCO|nr:Elongator complex protein 1 [Candida viswanathii]